MPFELASLLKADFRLLIPTTKTRRVQAALAVMASRIAASQLDKAQLAKVDAEIVRLYKPFGLYPWWNLRADRAESDSLACERSVAMWRLNMPTGVPGMSWSDILHPWHRRNPTQLIQDFRPFHKDTDEALAQLSRRGISLPPNLHYGQSWLLQSRTTSTENEA